MEVPREADAQVVVVIPVRVVVVDVEPVPVEVADIDAVAVRIEICPLPSTFTEKLEVASSFLYFIREHPPFGGTSTRNKQEVPSPFSSHAIKTHEL